MFPLPASSNIYIDSPQDLLRSWLRPFSQSPPSNGETGLPNLNTVARFYKQRYYQLAWFDRHGLMHQGKVLLNRLKNSHRQGLNPTEYRLKQWEPALKNVHLGRVGGNLDLSDEIVRLDIALTQSFFKYASDLQYGRLHPDDVTVVDRPKSDLSPELIAQRLRTAIGEGSLESFFQDLSPRHTQYHLLKKYLVRFETIKQLGGWPMIPDGPALKLGTLSPRVPILSKHLLITGDLPLMHFSPQEQFKEPLEAAVKSYQRRNGIAADGIVGQKTLDCLSISVEARIAQIKLNMERWRWLPADLGTQHLMVNIPGFELKIIENHTVQSAMRVIVGRKKRQTPILSSTLTYLEFNPFWNIPQTIARKDILPKIKSDPQYLSKNNIQVLSGWEQNAPMIDPSLIDWHAFSENYLPYRLRQDPAPHNALGQVKFMFPNHHSVYIHDTPGKALFNKEMRSFSSGCVRVEHPLELAHLLLKNQQWDHQRIAKTIDSKKRRTIVMKHPIPVHLVYFTAWTDENDTLHFGQDIYGRDQRLSEALRPKKPAKRWCSNDKQGSGGFYMDQTQSMNLINLCLTGAIQM
jgi:L,D-transpeptidase YcbB